MRVPACDRGLPSNPRLFSTPNNTTTEALPANMPAGAKGEQAREGLGVPGSLIVPPINSNNNEDSPFSKNVDAGPGSPKSPPAWDSRRDASLHASPAKTAVTVDYGDSMESHRSTFIVDGLAPSDASLLARGGAL